MNNINNINDLTENIEQLISLTKEITDYALTMSIATNYGKQFNFANISRVRQLANKELKVLRAEHKSLQAIIVSQILDRQIGLEEIKTEGKNE